MLRVMGGQWVRLGDAAVYWDTHTSMPLLGHPQYGMQLYRNYQQAQARLSQHPWITPTPLVSAPHPLQLQP